MKNKNSKSRKIVSGDSLVRGIAIGKAHLFGSRIVEFPKGWIDQTQVQAECHRFKKAIQNCKDQLNQIKSKLCRIQGKDHITILDSHIYLLQDELLVRNTINRISNDYINAEWALHKSMAEIKEAFSKIHQVYLKERLHDINAIESALLKILIDGKQLFFQKIPKGSIIVAHTLSPAEVLYLSRFGASGVVIDMGGLHSHTAIVAKSMEIPVIIGLEGICDEIAEEEDVIINSDESYVILHPTQQDFKRFEKLKNESRKSYRLMKKEAQNKAVTLDGHTINVLANMELLDEMDSILSSGADGIGLFRTEFFFMDRKESPSYQEQKKIYSEALKKFESKDVMIRTVDLGADKIKPGETYTEQLNPALGLRAVRFCLKEKEMFLDQLKALLVSNSFGNLKICFPMISSLSELKAVTKILKEARISLKKEKISFPENISIGVMIETPAAVMEADLLAAEVDFFSVGTNDLVQYLLAVDRNNDLVSEYYSPFHPSVIRSLKRISDVAKTAKIDVTVCGEMAADPVYLHLLLGLGFNTLSMNAASIPRIKKLIKMTTFSKTQLFAEKILSLKTHREVQKFVQNSMKEEFPAYF